jgi:hypothetical protein
MGDRIGLGHADPGERDDRHQRNKHRRDTRSGHVMLSPPRHFSATSVRADAAGAGTIPNASKLTRTGSSAEAAGPIAALKAWHGANSGTTVEADGPGQ